MLKGFGPIPEGDEVEKADNVFEKMAESDNSEEALQGELQKADIMNAISYDSNIRFSKLGKEIKAKLKADVLPSLNAKLQVLSAEIESKLEDCGGVPTESVPAWWTSEIKMELPFRIFSWQDRDCSPGPQLAGTLVGEEKENPVTPEMCRCREEYNDKVREYANVATDVKACEILETNLSDNERYQLSPRQLTVFGF
nr:MAG TPA: hypothetical protein [Caudoviricetes sp.]DAG96080.1 MAG TPA: hypothetical protein [Herelleviridae sp.]